MKKALHYIALAIGARFMTWRAGRALARNQRRRENHKQHWQAGKIGGGATMQIGFMTEAEAIARVESLKGENEPIAFVDFERGFIAHGTMPERG
jgi:hypothetical protein